jgi:hypothetical protein
MFLEEKYNLILKRDGGTYEKERKREGRRKGGINRKRGKTSRRPLTSLKSIVSR